MSSELQTLGPWSGPLKSKKKSELQQICRQLAIDYKSDSLKADLEQQIRKKFKDEPSLQDDERFTKLDHNVTSSSPNGVSSRRSNRARSVSRHRESDNDASFSRQREPDNDGSVSRQQEPDNDEQSVIDHELRRSNPSAPRKSIASQGSTNSEQSALQQILVTLINPEQDPNHHTRSKSHADAAKQPSMIGRLAQQTSHQILYSVNSSARHATDSIVAGIQAIQTTFSTPWKLCVTAIVLELIFVIYSTMSLRQGIYIQPKPDGPSVQIPEPIIRLFNHIISKSFLRPFLEYLGLTVVVPFVISGFMNVPSSRKQPEKNKQSLEAMRDLKPSVFLYCATRLAVLALVHTVFYPNHRFGWPNQNIYIRPFPPSSALDSENHTISQGVARNMHLSGFESIQYITTAFAMAISLHQLIRSSP